MRRLRRTKSTRPPADWKQAVDASFADAAVFWKKAKAFEKLAEAGARRGKGFKAYAPEVLPPDAEGKPEFPPLWRSDARVRVAIARMSSGFCAYCESPVSSNHPGTKGEEKPPGQVEHFKPKSLFPAQAYAWENYFLGCIGCNGAKHDKWASGGYVRPDEGDPGSRFVFSERGRVKGRKGDEQAASTIEDFGMNRYWLTRHRGNAIQSHLEFVRRMIGRPGFQLEDVLITRAVAFSEAINQNVRRVWAKGQGKARAPRGRIRSGGPAHGQISSR